jgi:hypothetical protein
MSTRLGVGDKEGILEDFNRLFGRVWAATPCPIEADDLPAMHNLMVPETYRKLARALDQKGYNVKPWFNTSTQFVTTIEDKLVEFDLTIGYPDDVFKQFMQRPKRKDGRNWYAITPELFRESFGARAAEMLEWGINRAKLYSEAHAAWGVTNEILEMTSTAGQIKRMVPEMLDYLPKAKATALREQKRASSVPYQWGAYDRRKVRSMLLAMSKAHLMPTETNTYRQGKITNLPALKADLVYPDTVAAKEGEPTPQTGDSE